MSVSYDIRNLKTKGDLDRKRAEFFKLLKLQQKLNSDYEKAVAERSANEQLGITPVPPQKRSVEEEKMDETMQMQIADRNLRTIMKEDEAKKVLSRLIDSKEVFLLNSVFKPIEKRLEGETNLTAEYFLQVFRRYVEARARPDITNKELGEEIQRIASGQMGMNPATGQPYTVGEAVEQLADEYQTGTKAITDMLKGMKEGTTTGTVGGKKEQEDLIKLLIDAGVKSVLSSKGRPMNLINKKGQLNTQIPIQVLRVEVEKLPTEMRVSSGLKPTIFNLTSFERIPNDLSNAKQQGIIDSFQLEESTIPDLPKLKKEIKTMPVERIPFVSAYIVSLNESLGTATLNEDTERKWRKILVELDQALERRQREFPQEEEVEIPLYGDEPMDPYEKKRELYNEIIDNEEEPGAMIENYGAMTPEEINNYDTLWSELETDLTVAYNRGEIDDDLYQRWMAHIDDQMREIRRFEPTLGRGMKKQKKTSLKKYGTGYIQKPRYGRRIVGRGIEKQPETYKKFGRYLIYLPALRKGYFHLKYPSFTNCVLIPKREISVDLKEFIEDMLENGTINKRLYEKLNADDRRYFNSVAEKSRIDEQVGIADNVMKQNREEMKRFELVKGIVMAGQNSPEVLKELADWLTKFSREGKLNKNQVQEIMMDLISVR